MKNLIIDHFDPLPMCEDEYTNTVVFAVETCIHSTLITKDIYIFVHSEHITRAFNCMQIYLRTFKEDILNRRNTFIKSESEMLQRVNFYNGSSISIFCYDKSYHQFIGVAPDYIIVCNYTAAPIFKEKLENILALSIEKRNIKRYITDIKEKCKCIDTKAMLMINKSLTLEEVI